MTGRRLRPAAVAAVLVAAALVPGPAGPAAATPGQERGDGVAVLVLRDVVLTGVGLSGATDPDSSPAGGPAKVVRIRVRELRGTGLGLDRVLPDGTVRISAPQGRSSGRDVVVDATWACVRGLGVTTAGLLRGALDGALNEALDVDPVRGFRTTPVVVLANLVGAARVPLVVRELRVEVAGLRAGDFRLPGAIVERTLRRGSPAPGCGAGAAVQRAASPTEQAGAAQVWLTRLRREAGPLARLPSRLGR